MKLKIALLIIILGLLALTNPSMDDFKLAAEERVKTEMEKKSELEQALGNLFGGTLSSLIASKTKRSNYFLFSVYSLNVNKEDYKYIGVASLFVPLQKNLPFEDDQPEKP